jgi:hypothetical protein
MALQTIISFYDETVLRRGPGEVSWSPRRAISITVHTGAFASMIGIYARLLCGLGLLFFSVGGALFCWGFYRSRRAQGQAGPFWRARASKVSVTVSNFAEPQTVTLSEFPNSSGAAA